MGGFAGGQTSPEQMESKESQEEEIEDNSFIGKLKSFFGKGKKKDDSDRIVGLGMPSLEWVVAGAD